MAIKVEEIKNNHLRSKSGNSTLTSSLLTKTKELDNGQTFYVQFAGVTVYYIYIYISSNFEVSAPYGLCTKIFRLTTTNCFSCYVAISPFTGTELGLIAGVAFLAMCWR